MLPFYVSSSVALLTSAMFAQQDRMSDGEVIQGWNHAIVQLLIIIQMLVGFLIADRRAKSADRRAQQQRQQDIEDRERQRRQDIEDREMARRMLADKVQVTQNELAEKVTVSQQEIAAKVEQQQVHLAEKVETTRQEIAAKVEERQVILEKKLDHNTAVSENAFVEANDVNKKIQELGERFNVLVETATAGTIQKQAEILTAVKETGDDTHERVKKIEAEVVKDGE
jgi:uncharacterized membrane protein